VTLNDPTFFQLMQQFSEVTRQGRPDNFQDSNWLLTLSIYRQPYYRVSPRTLSSAGLRLVP